MTEQQHIEALAEVLDQLPETWMWGSERNLLLYLWSALETKGIVQQGSHRQHVASIAALLALHELKTRFYAYAFDEGDRTSYDSPAYDLIGDYPLAEPFWVGVVAGSLLDVDEAPGREPESPWPVEVLEALADSRYRVIAAALLDALGENTLFAALWHSRQQDAVFPVPVEVAYDILNSDPWEKMEAFDWVREGLRR